MRANRLKAAVAVLGVVLVGCPIGSFCNVRPTARREQCRQNLQKLYAALRKYVSLHNNLPRDGKGKVSIDALADPEIQTELGIDPSEMRCPTDHDATGPSYILNPTLSVADLKDGSATVVACDARANHPGLCDQHDCPASNVLVADGSTRVMALPPKEREQWLRLFLSGDKRASKCPEDGDWFTGAEKAEKEREDGGG
jgi:hypothetical protein